jgi:hypothetical protein
LIKVDHVEAESTEARVAGGSNSVRVQSLAARIRDSETHLRCNHDLIAVSGQPRCESALGLSIAVDVGGVDERAAGFDRSSIRWASLAGVAPPLASCPGKVG